jgi:hypothetical protein
MIDFPAALGALVESGVRFIIVGGAAATAHGAARLTKIWTSSTRATRRTSVDSSRPSASTGHTFAALLRGFLSCSTSALWLVA